MHLFSDLKKMEFANIRFEILNLLKETMLTSRSKLISSPWRKIRINITHERFTDMKSTYLIGGRFCQCHNLVKDMNLDSIRRYSPSLESQHRFYFFPVNSTWRFMLRKRTLKVETQRDCFETLTKYYLTIRFVCDKKRDN
jgi:hypothetical protein